MHSLSLKIAIDQLNVDKVGHTVNFVYLPKLIKFHSFKTCPGLTVYNVILLLFHIQCVSNANNQHLKEILC